MIILQLVAALIMLVARLLPIIVIISIILVITKASAEKNKSKDNSNCYEAQNRHSRYNYNQRESTRTGYDSYSAAKRHADLKERLSAKFAHRKNTSTAEETVESYASNKTVMNDFFKEYGIEERKCDWES